MLTGERGAVLTMAENYAPLRFRQKGSCEAQRSGVLECGRAL
jgi:hypothetical protein